MHTAHDDVTYVIARHAISLVQALTAHRERKLPEPPMNRIDL